MYLKFTKVRDVHAPTRGHPGDAGLDFYVPNTFISMELKPCESVTIPSGIKVEVPVGTALIFFNKSGVASKQDIIVGACVIDHAYSGEIHLNMINVGQETRAIIPGQKMVQGILLPILCPQMIEVSELELYQEVGVLGSRETGGFGSTGA